MEEKTLTKSITVTEDELAITMGSGSLYVLATPAVVALMENAAAELAQSQLESDELTTVGTAISIEHTSPTPIGAKVTATAVLKSTDGRFFNFEVYLCRKLPEGVLLGTLRGKSAQRNPKVENGCPYNEQRIRNLFLIRCA